MDKQTGVLPKPANKAGEFFYLWKNPLVWFIVSSNQGANNPIMRGQQISTMQENVLWQAVLGEVELSISRGNFVTWFKNTQLLSSDDEQVVIGVPNVFVKNQLERKFNDLVSKVLVKNGVNAKLIEYKIHSGGSVAAAANEPVVLKNPSDSTNPPKPNTKARGLANITHSYRQGLNARYSFDNFVVGAGNELAYAAAQAIAAKPGSKYNPLFIYGGVGIGKTHLIQAIGNAISSNKPDSKIIYASTEQFVQEFVDAIRYKKNTSDFADYYRSADVLIVDDVQFLAGKERVQEEFFHTFNALHQANKQIIMSSDKPPRDISPLEERLRSRFGGGMTIDMQAPDFETRCAILQIKASGVGIELPGDVVEFLAGRIQSNIRELEGSLNQVLAFCEMRGVSPSLDIVQNMFELEANRPKHVSPRQIIERTAKYFHVPMDDILGPKRDKDIVVPRQVAMFLLRNELHLSFPKIAHELGRKDHTTAIHSIEKIQKEMSYDSPIRGFVTDLKEKLYV